MAASPSPPAASSKVPVARLNVVSSSITSSPPKGERATDEETTSTSSTSSSSPVATAIKNAAAASLWISLSATVILFNKHILAFSGFPFPISLTSFHMAFAFCCSAFLIHCTPLVELPTRTVTAAATPARDAERDPLNSISSSKTVVRGLDAETYLRRVAPIGALFAGTLWLGNAAYLHLSVSLVQMLKALMPAAVYGVGCVLGTEEFKRSRALNMAVVTLGVAAASAGEVTLSVLGLALQLGSIATESTRLALVQILLQKKKKKIGDRKEKSKSSGASPAAAAESKKESIVEVGKNDDDKISLNPVTTMYYLAPASLLCLSLPWLAFERTALAEAWRSNAGSSPSPPLSWWHLGVSPLTLVANASLAFALNLSVFLLIGRTSALAMNVAGVVKDWLLIGLSALLFHAPVTKLNLLGYSIAFAGVCWYNKAKFDEMKEGAAKAAAADGTDEARGTTSTPSSSTGSELKPLVASSLSRGGGGAGYVVSSSPSSEERKIKAGRAA